MPADPTEPTGAREVGEGRWTPIQDVRPRPEILLPESPLLGRAVVTSFTDYRASCDTCHWSGEAWPRREDADADMREHNEEFHVS